jgi:hypothetical protein
MYSLQTMTDRQLHNWCMHVIKMGNMDYKASLQYEEEEQFQQ